MKDPLERIGRPSDMTKVVATERSGHKTTVVERVVQVVRAGGPITYAAKAAGMSPYAIYEWVKTGAKCHNRHAQGTKRSEFTAHERRCMDFANALQQAEGEMVAEAVARLAQGAAGGRQVTTVTERVDSAGDLVDRSTRIETLAPDPKIDMWRLRTRAPAEFTTRVEISGPEGEPVPIEVRAANLADGLRDFLAGAAAGVEVASEQSEPAVQA